MWSVLINLRSLPLHCACNFGHLPVIQFLVLEAKCNVECTDNNGRTPLHCVSTFPSLEESAYDVIEFLLRNRAIPNAASKEGETPLDTIRPSRTTQLLFKYGAQPKYENWKMYILVQKSTPHSTR